MVFGVMYGKIYCITADDGWNTFSPPPLFFKFSFL